MVRLRVADMDLREARKEVEELKARMMELEEAQNTQVLLFGVTRMPVLLTEDAPLGWSGSFCGHLGLKPPTIRSVQVLEATASSRDQTISQLEV